MPGHLGSPDAGKKGGKERLLPRTMISDQQSAPGSWRWARGTHSLLPEPGERMRIQAEGPGRGPEPLSTSLPPGKGGGLPPRVWEGAPSSVHHCGAGDEWLLALVLCNPQPCQPPRPCGASLVLEPPQDSGLRETNHSACGCWRCSWSSPQEVVPWSLAWAFSGQ